MTYFYIAALITLIVIPGMISFAEWWNRRHGLDENGNPIAGRPQHGAGG